MTILLDDTEKVFWQDHTIANTKSGAALPVAIKNADNAVREFRKRLPRPPTPENTPRKLANPASAIPTNPATLKS